MVDRVAEIGEGLDIVGLIWDKSTWKQREALIMFSDAPLTTPKYREWKDLPEYSKQMIFDYWAAEVGRNE